MKIRKARTWCEDCTAPEVFPENVPIVLLFLDALPAWQVAGGMGGGPLMPGFDRSQVASLMRLHGIKPKRWRKTWAAIRELEGELRGILDARRAAEAPPKAVRHG